MERRYCEALDGLWQRRERYLAVKEIVDSALQAAEHYIDNAQLPDQQSEIIWFGRLTPGDLCVLEICAPALKHMGLDPVDICGKPLSKFVSVANALLVQRAALRSLTTGLTSEAFSRDRDGRILRLDVRTAVYDGRLEILAVAYRSSVRLYQREPVLVGEAA